jgi:hypothetical protein
MSGKYLLDTCFLIGLQQRYPDAIAIVQAKQLALRDCAFSVISRIELLSYPNLTATDENTIRAMLGQMTCLPLSQTIEEYTIMVRRSKKVKLPDALILATAKVHGLTLLTLDQRLETLSLSI